MTHLEEHGISWYSHMKLSLWCSLQGLKMAYWCLVHSFFPETYRSTTSEMLKGWFWEEYYRRLDYYKEQENGSN